MVENHWTHFVKIGIPKSNIKKKNATPKYNLRNVHIDIAL